MWKSLQCKVHGIKDAEEGCESNRRLKENKQKSRI